MIRNKMRRNVYQNMCKVELYLAKVFGSGFLKTALPIKNSWFKNQIKNMI
jgi:hypothetical protein